MSAKNANRKLRKLFPLVKIGAKHGGVPVHLKQSGHLFAFEDASESLAVC